MGPLGRSEQEAIRNTCVKCDKGWELVSEMTQKKNIESEEAEQRTKALMGAKNVLPGGDKI